MKNQNTASIPLLSSLLYSELSIEKQTKTKLANRKENSRLVGPPKPAVDLSSMKNQNTASIPLLSSLLYSELSIEKQTKTKLANRKENSRLVGRPKPTVGLSSMKNQNTASVLFIY
jgi:hypothetical protein